MAVTADAARVRARPGMYVGDVHDGSGLERMFWEVAEAAIEECLDGRAHGVRVCVEADGSYVVEHDGRGMALDDALRELTTVHTEVDAGYLRRRRRFASNGTGLAAVVALSEVFVIETRVGGRVHRARWERGELVEPFVDIGAAARAGVMISFRPDSTIFTCGPLRLDRLLERIRQLTALYPGLTIELAVAPRVITAPRGLAEYVEGLVVPHRRHHEHAFFHENTDADRHVAIALLFTWERFGLLRTFVNGAETAAGGVHRNGFVDALRATFPSVREESLLGCVAAVVSVSVDDPQYWGASKDRLVGPDLRPLVAKETHRMMVRIERDDPKLLDRVRSSARRT